LVYLALCGHCFPPWSATDTKDKANVLRCAVHPASRSGEGVRRFGDAAAQFSRWPWGRRCL